MITQAQMTPEQKTFVGVASGLPINKQSYFYDKFKNLPVLTGNDDKGDIVFQYRKGKQGMSGMYVRDDEGVVTGGVDDFIEQTVTPGEIIEHSMISPNEIRRIKEGQTVFTNMNGTQISTAQQLAAAKLQNLKERVIRRINFNWAQVVREGKVWFSDGVHGFNFEAPTQKTLAVTASTDWVTVLNDKFQQCFEETGLTPDYCYVGSKIVKALLGNKNFKETVYMLGQGMAKDLKFTNQGYFLGMVGNTMIEQAPFVLDPKGKSYFSEYEIVMGNTSVFYKGQANIAVMNRTTRLADFFNGEFWSDIVIADEIRATSKIIVKSGAMPIVTDANAIQNTLVTGL
jgi:hypothetical protein